MKTILYASDFNKYPNAIIDLDSANRSWVEFASKLKAMGVKNWGFHLTLHDPALVGVDPRDPNLTDVAKLKIKHEAKINCWYYPREMFRVPSKTGGNPIHLRANRANIAAYWSLFNAFITYLQQIRQTGKSLQVRSIVSGFHMCWAKGSNHILFTKTDLRADEIKAYKEIKADTPEYMYYNTGKDKDNQQDFTTECHKNTTYSYNPSNDPEGANKIGRGKSPVLITPDEVPFLTHADISIAALIGSTQDTFPDAARNNRFHGIFYTTTAGDLSTKEGMFVYEEIKMKGMFFSEMLYDAKDRDHAIEIIFANSRCKPVPHITISFNHLQLGYSDAWLREALGRNPGKADKKKQDQLNIWTFGSQSNPIEKYLPAIRRSVRDDFVSELMNTPYVLRLHRDLEYIKSRTVVMGLDTSDAIGRDSITGVAVDIETLETLMCFSINETNLHNFGLYLVMLLMTFPKLTLIPEAKSSWSSGLRDQLLVELPKVGIDIGRRVFSYIVQDSKVDEKAKRDYRDYSTGYPTEYKYNAFRTKIGFMTGSASRDVLTRDILINVAKEIPHLMVDPILVDELSTLVERNGRIDHALSGNDDHVISLCLAHWLLRYGRNLEHYGIDPTKIMRAVTSAEPPDVKKQMADKKRDQVNKEIAILLDRMEASSSSMEIAYIEARLKILQGTVSDVDDPSKLPSSLAAKADSRSVENRRRQARSEGMFSRMLNRR